jgi:cyclic-di-GMP-binding biofilm dispersal mediator protein
MTMTAQTAVARYPLQGSAVLVAGATGGLGSALASELHRRGATLTLVARDQGRLDALPVPGVRLAADLRSAAACEQAVAAAGRLDILVNALGVVSFGNVVELSPEALANLFATNVFAPILLARAALPVMSQGGAIVNISGVIAERNLPGMAAYGASKAAIRSFGQAFAREARRSQVRVLDARPPHTETGLVGRALEGLAPKMPEGISPGLVARVICDALESGATDLPSTDFAVPAA